MPAPRSPTRRRRPLRRVVLFALLPLLVLALAACGATPAPDQNPPPGADTAFERYLDRAIDGELVDDVRFEIAAANVAAQTAPAEPPAPVAFTATSSTGVEFQGMLLHPDGTPPAGTAPARIRGQIGRAENVPFMVGVADPGGGATPWAFVAVALGSRLPGPEVGSDWDVLGRLRSVTRCDPEHRVGMGILEQERTGTRLPLALVGFHTSCSAPLDRSAADAYTEATSVDTTIGRLLVGEGTLAYDAAADDAPAEAAAFLAVAVDLAPRLRNPGFSGDLQPDVVLLEPFDLARLNAVEPGGELTWNLEDTWPTRAEMEVGTLLVAKPTPLAPHGFLRRIEAVTVDGNVLRTTTRSAALQEMIASGGFRLERSLDDADLEQLVPLTPGVTFRPRESAGLRSAADAAELRLPLPLPNADFDLVLVDLDGDHATTDDQLRADGALTLDAGITVEFSCSGPFCGDVYFKGAFDFTETLEVTVTGELNRSVDHEVPLFSATFGVIMIGPIALTPKFEATLNADGELDVFFEARAEQTLELDAGIELENGAWKPISSVVETLDADDPIFEGSLEAKVRAGLDAGLYVFGAAGAGVDIGAYVRLGAGVPRTPVWDVAVGVDGFAYVALDLLILSAELDFPLFEEEWVVLEAPNTPPSIERILVDHQDPTDPSRAPLPVVQLAPTGIEIDAFDDEEGVVCCSVTVTSNLEGELGSSGAAVREHLVVADFTILGLHEITVEVRDADGASVSETFEVDVGEGIEGAAVSRCFGYALALGGSPLPGAPATVELQVDNWGDNTGCAESPSWDGANEAYEVIWYLDDEFLATGATLDDATRSDAVTFDAEADRVYRVEAHAFDAVEGGIASIASLAFEVGPITALGAVDAAPLVGYAGDDPSEPPSHPLREANLEVGAPFELEYAVPGELQDWRVVTEVDGTEYSATEELFGAYNFLFEFDAPGWHTFETRVTDPATGAVWEQSVEVYVREETGFGGRYLAPGAACRGCP